MHTRSIVLALLLPAIGQAQASKTFSACFVPSVGAMYLIKATGLPTACILPSHVEFTWIEGAVADAAVTTVKIADGAVTAAKLSADVANAVVTDGSITLPKMGFDVATQTELDSVIATLGATGSLNAAGNPLEWTKLKNVPSLSLANHTHALSGTRNTGAGVSALAANTGVNNTAFGFIALEANTVGSSNTAIGATAMQLTTTGNQNTAVGTAALRDNVTGTGNTAVGFGALLLNTVGQNTAVGYNALLDNTTGINNTAVGHMALLENATTEQNVAVGTSALRDHAIGSLNTAVGSFSMAAHTSGGSNTALGQATLGVLTTGSNNTALGRNAGVALTSGSNNVYIANDGVSTEDLTIRIGSAQTQAFIAGVRGVEPLGVGIPVLIDPDGQLGTEVSSRRFKQNIADMNDASARLMRLRPVTFRYRQHGDGGPLQYGLIAEEVAEVFPELAARSKDGEIETVRYQLLSVLLLNEMQRQERELAELKRAVAELQARLTR